MTAVPWRSDSSGLSTVVVRMIDYEALCSKARAYDRLIADLFPFFLLFSLAFAGMAAAAIYWYWRAKTSEEDLACRQKPMPRIKPLYDPMAGVLKAIGKKLRERNRNDETVIRRPSPARLSVHKRAEKKTH